MKKIRFRICIMAIFLCAMTACQKELPTERPEETLKTDNSKAIIGGQPTSIQTVPYQVNVNGSGGGVIIGDRWIVTAAHVVQSFVNSPGGVSIIAGDSKVTGTPESTRQLRNADAVILHPSWQNAQEFDIALIRLSQPLTFNLGVQPIAYSIPSDPLAVNNLAYVSGWGLIRFDGFDSFGRPTGLQTNNLFGTNVRIADLANPRIVWTSSTSGSQQAPCIGDSGGPLTVNFPNMGKVLVGVVNGWGDCNVGQKGYARISNYADWILDVTGIGRYDILGVNQFCNSGTYTVSGLPSGAVVTWSASPTAYAQLTTTGSTALLTYNSFGEVVLTAHITNNGVSIGTATKKVISGDIFVGEIYGAPDNVMLCPGSTVDLNFSGPAATWSVLNGTILSQSGNNIRVSVGSALAGTTAVQAIFSDGCGRERVVQKTIVISSDQNCGGGGVTM
ncbi:serine protease [Sphingobacterium bambusae]|uniref:Serine protease n=1 Tax=Sphingobacterium bambusae TaxID=662858 RepID=A0ABW6BBY8_9SPHI|nr:serine protease [Sphingobacterium bambusae]WPL47153.1 serine protease [Sphingobacterium bambusae]